METNRFILHSFGHIGMRKNTELTRYKWNIVLRVRADTSQKDAEHFHIAWGRIFNEMHEKFGPLFCNVYGSQLRRDMHDAVKNVTQAYYCVEQAAAGFDVSTSEINWEWGMTYELLDMNVQIMPMSE